MVDTVSREFNGEKIVSRYTLEQARRNGDDIAAVKTRPDRVEAELRQDIGELRQDIFALKNDVAGLRKELPSIVGTLGRTCARELTPVLAE